MMLLRRPLHVWGADPRTEEVDMSFVQSRAPPEIEIIVLSCLSSTTQIAQGNETAPALICGG